MKAKFLASLEEAIRIWGESICVDDDIPDLYWPDNYAELMAKSASAVFDGFVAEKKHIDENV